MSLLTIRVFADQQAASDARHELEVAGFTVEGPTRHDPVAWDATQAGGQADGIAGGWVVIARQ